MEQQQKKNKSDSKEARIDRNKYMSENEELQKRLEKQNIQMKDMHMEIQRQR